jgi:hypothetical protein
MSPRGRDDEERPNPSRKAEGVPMQRMCGVSARVGLLSSLFMLAGATLPAHADLIRPSPGRSFPDIAGDIGGSQTYVYDPSTQTGTFALINAPHLISLGPSGKDLIPMQPDHDGTLYQTLKLKLDRSGRLIDSPLNQFEIRGTVIINDRVYEGLLLKGRPTAFATTDQASPALKNPGVFGLNMQIEGGELAGTFGTEAYLRIVPQANSTFRGEFTCDFSGEKPLTNLIAVDRRLSAHLIGPVSLIGLLAGTAALVAWRIVRLLARMSRRCSVPRRRPVAQWAASTW